MSNQRRLKMEMCKIAGGSENHRGLGKTVIVVGPQRQCSPLPGLRVIQMRMHEYTAMSLHDARNLCEYIIHVWMQFHIWENTVVIMCIQSYFQGNAAYGATSSVVSITCSGHDKHKQHMPQPSFLARWPHFSGGEIAGENSHENPCEQCNFEFNEVVFLLPVGLQDEKFRDSEGGCAPRMGDPRESPVTGQLPAPTAMSGPKRLLH